MGADQALQRLPVRARMTVEQAETLCRKMGGHIELFPGEEGGGAYVSLPDLGFGDYGQDVPEAMANLVEKAFQVATTGKEPGEKWTPKLEALVARLREALAR